MSEETTDVALEPQAIAGAEQMFGGAPVRRFKTLDPLPVRGLVCRIQSLFEQEVSDYQVAVHKSSGSGMRMDKLRSAERRLIKAALVDANNQPYVANSHLIEMAKWDYADINFLYTEIAKHVGLNKDDISDLVKNSEETPEDA